MAIRTSLVRVAIVLFCWAIAAHAFESNNRETQSIANHPFQSTGQAMRPDPTQPTPSSCALYSPQLSFDMPGESRLKIKACRSVALRHYLVSKSSTLFSASTPDAPGDAGVESKKKGFLARLRSLLFFPLKFFILKPIKLLAELVVDNLDPDGTVPVSEDIATKATLVSVSNAAELSQNTPLSSVVVEDSRVEDGASIARNDRVVGDAPVEAVISKPLVTDELTVASPSESTTRTKPKGDRWQVAAPDIDMTGDWEVIVTDKFKHEYDKYLLELGQPMLVRSVAMGIIGQTTEETKQTDNGKSLLIRGRNLRGVWDRTLVASGTDIGHDEYEPLQIPVMSADSEQVKAESWWEEEGTVHVSWLRGVTKYGGGAFESRRYLDDNGDTYVCESTFHPNNKKKGPLSLTWRFRRHTL